MSQSTSPRRGRFRFFYQFSLRTLLLATAAAALFCNWYFQPKYYEEKLAGDELRLRRQVKVADPNEPPPRIAGRIVAPSYDPNILNHGNWSLLDSDDFTLTRGRFIENEATGNWTAWYPTGGKAAEGKMLQGVKAGRWRTWYEDGTLASEITFSDRPVKRLDFDPDRPNPGGYGGGYDGYSLAPRRPVASTREGLAKAWHENGRLKYEGNFVVDKQEGIWTFYDSQGHISEAGPFRARKRHGHWTVTQNASEGQTSKPLYVHYVDGRTDAELNDILARLTPLLSSQHRRQCYAALIDLADIGEGAAPLLIDRLTHGDSGEQAVVIGAVARMPSGGNLILPQVRELVDSSNAQVAHQARLTLFQLDADARDKLFEPLLADAIAAPTLGLCLEELSLLYHCDETRRGIVFAQLMELPVRRDDSDLGEVAIEAANLGGDVTAYVVAACGHANPAVRLQAVAAIDRLRPGWYQQQSWFGLDDKAREELFSKLRHDPSSDVRRAAEALDTPRGPQGSSGNWGIPSGGYGSGFPL